MADPGRNRFQLEDGENQDDSFVDSESVFQANAESHFKRRRNFQSILTASAVIILMLIFGGVLYYFFQDNLKYAWNFFTSDSAESTGSDSSGPFLDEKSLEFVPDMKERFFFPEQKVSPALASAISAYRQNDRSRALREFEKFLESSAEDKEKSVALVYMGIMALETERFPLAKHHFERALKYDEKSIPALVNLAIAEQKMGNLEDAKGRIAEAEKLDPDNPKISIISGNLMAAGLDLDAAVKKYKSGIENSDKDPFLHFNLALSLLRSGKYDEAVLYFSKTIEMAGPGEIAAKSHAHLGQIYFSRGNFEMAADHLNQAVKLVPDHGRYLYNLGIVYLNLRQPDRAEDFFKKALDAGAGDAVVFRSLAHAFRDLKEPSLAVRSLEKALYRNPEDMESWFLLGKIYEEESDLNSAAEAYKKIVNMTAGDSYTRDALIKLGGVYTELERYNEAFEVYQKAVQIDPGSIQARYGLGKVYYHAGNKDLAAREWKKALQKPPGSNSHPPLERRQERIVRTALGLMYMEEGAFDLSLQQFRLIQSRNKESPVISEDPELSFLMGQAYSRMKEYTGALKHFAEAAESRSADPDQRKKAFLEMAKIQSLSGNPEDLETARSNAAKAVRLDPDDEKSSIAQAEILLKSKSLSDREKAIEVLLAVTSSSDLSSKDASAAHNILGEAYYANGEFARALRAFEYSYQLDPSNSEAYANQRAAANAYEQSLRR
ncbi:MAG: tetratricopeptide repeat protein [Spirochaetia bacterium]|nr:tetratricopeptide repeat protein [Spirochaetia bacterium]